MTRKIFRSMAAVSLAVLAASLVLIVGVLHGYFQDQVLEELRQKTVYAAQGVEQAGMDYLTGDLPRDSRVTWVATDGTVLFDNWEDPANMASHADRAEIREALLTGKGSSARYSNTLAEKTLYYALRLSDGSVLRMSDTQDAVWLLVLEAVQPVAFVLLAALALALRLSGRVARQLVAPINAMDLEDPEGEPPYEELAPLLGRIRSQNRQIQHQMLDLQRRQEEFGAITENMSEGLLVIDRETRVLSYNTAALRLLRADKPQEGESAYALNREAGFRRCVEGALSGQRTEQLLEREGSCRQVIASPVQQEGAVGGAVLVVLDVTEKEQREQLRREFTANVSHELKTPLTSILGTAEKRPGAAGGHPPLRREHPPGGPAAHRPGERHHQALPPGRGRERRPVGDRGALCPGGKCAGPAAPGGGNKAGHIAPGGGQGPCPGRAPDFGGDPL